VKKLGKEVRRMLNRSVADGVVTVEEGAVDAVAARTTPGRAGVVKAVAAVGAGASKDVRRKDAGKAPQLAGPFHCTFSHNILTVSPFAPLFTNLLEGEFSEARIQHPA
jgi:hypothetical protein